MSEDRQILFGDVVAPNLKDKDQVFTIESMLNNSNASQSTSKPSKLSCPSILLQLQKSRKSSGQLNRHIHHCRIQRDGHASQNLSIVKLGLVDHPINPYDKKIREFSKPNLDKSNLDKSNLDKSNLDKSSEMGLCTSETPLLKRDCPFPYQSTGKQNYNAEEFEAYRLLGKNMAFEYLSSASIE